MYNENKLGEVLWMCYAGSGHMDFLSDLCLEHIVIWTQFFFWFDFFLTRKMVIKFNENGKFDRNACTVKKICRLKNGGFCVVEKIAKWKIIINSN